MKEDAFSDRKDPATALPTPPPGGTIRITLEWLEAQNKADTKERRNALRSQIEKEISSLLEKSPPVDFSANASNQRMTWNLLIQKHVGGIALVAGSPYKMIKASSEDEELMPRVKVLEQKIRKLVQEYASLFGIIDLPDNLVDIADRIDMTFKEDRRLRNAILQRSHSITKVNNYILKSKNEDLLNSKMTTYYKTISQFINNARKSYEESVKNDSIAKANARRHATEWADFAHKYLIESLKLRAERGDKLLFQAAQSRYEREITQRLLASATSKLIDATEALSKNTPKARADFVLRNGIEVDFKALGSRGFVAFANLPAKLKSKPFRIMAEIQQMAEQENRLPEMNLSFLGSPPTGLEISIGAHTNADIYELFAEFVVKSLSTIK